ncbi:discoidin domain-containing protein [Pseudobacteroides cellulosolvens]|uniref:Coagulation factor 5/8 type domain protein n=1 Tax=Pseudobacteroides cellulosolvens ATCC 35603 = DSM 2933 TaxID=398512 RepID=A0A0L6JTZ3_9FIRM|nr:discoidin domain-containing protein [Pseudobacteroides cellulosolvens]KNY28892.1 coagulation factor 5/8 type domain protein [Pseudobacteroides cellulosolvens ATCC 35603 = DSM 2933]
MKINFKKMACILLPLALLTATFCPMVTGAYQQGTLIADFSENNLNEAILTSLQDHTLYSEKIYHDYSGKIPGTGYFGSGDSGEDGIRTHNNYLLVYAFLFSENSGKLDRELLKSRIIAGIKYSVNTHKVGSYNCASNGKWGLVWESSLWTSALAYAGYLMGDELDSETREKLKNVVAAEADYNLNRTIPTQVKSDTKAEENGWDTNVLAIAANMYKEDSRAAQWDEKSKAFAMNTLSMSKDLTDQTIVDGKMVKEWVIGPNLYDDYSLENHGIFHPVYQMNPILELGDSALYYKMTGNEVPKAFEHNILDMYNTVLKKIVLATGEWAYPNGCDWSVDLLDHINSVAFMSTYFKDVDSKMLEHRLIQFIRARQLDNQDGRFIGPNSDIGARRESVQAERLVYTYMFHKYFGPGPSENTTWEDFVSRNSGSSTYTDGDIILNKNQNRFASFSWNSKNMGLVIPDSNNYLDNGFVNFPYQKSLTGSFTVKNKPTNQFHIKHKNRVESTNFTTTGLLSENDSTIDHYISFAALPGNAAVYMDVAKSKADITVTKEEGIPLAFQTDNISGNTRVVTSNDNSAVLDGTSLTNISGNWVNVDNSLSVVVDGSNGMKYGNRTLSNSVYYSTLYGSYNDQEKLSSKGDTIANRTAVFYSNIDSGMTANLSKGIIYPKMADGWKSAVTQDVYSNQYLIASNFYGNASKIAISLPQGAPVLAEDTIIKKNTSYSTLDYEKLDTRITNLFAFVESPSCSNLQAVQSSKVPGRFYIKNNGFDAKVKISIIHNGVNTTGQKLLKAGRSYMLELKDKTIKAVEAKYPEKPELEKIHAFLYDDKITVDWKVNFGNTAKYKSLNNSNKVLEYIIEKRKFGGKWSKAAAVPCNQTIYVDNDISSSSTYQYKITAVTDERTSSKASNYVATSPQADKYGLINILKGKPVYTSYQQSQYQPANVNDGDQNTFWVSENKYPSVTNSVYCTVDLLNKESINRIKIVPRKNYGPKDVEILISNDNIKFTSITTQTLPNSAYEIIIPPVTTRYISLMVKSSYDTVAPSRNVQIAELEVYKSAQNLFSPSYLTAEAGTFKNNNISWQDISNNEDGFIIERSSIEGVFEKIGVVGPNTTVFYDTNPISGQQYTYVVSAYNKTGRNYSRTSSVTTLSSGAGKVQNGDITAYASSAQANYPITKAFDDNAGTFYVSNEVPSSTSPAVIDLTLKETLTLDKLTFQPRINGSYYYNPKDISVYVAVYGSDYTKVKEASIPAGNTVQTVDIDLVKAEKIRIVVTSVNNPGATKNLQCAEIGVYSGVNSFDRITTAIDNSSLTKGSTAKLTVTEGKMSDGSTVDLNSAEYFYTTDDSTVAAVNDSGVITAIGQGTANIWVYVKVGDYWVRNSAQVSVIELMT